MTTTNTNKEELLESAREFANNSMVEWMNQLLSWCEAIYTRCDGDEELFELLVDEDFAEVSSDGRHNAWELIGGSFGYKVNELYHAVAY